MEGSAAGRPQLLERGEGRNEKGDRFGDLRLFVERRHDLLRCPLFRCWGPKAGPFGVGRDGRHRGGGASDKRCGGRASLEAGIMAHDGEGKGSEGELERNAWAGSGQ